MKDNESRGIDVSVRGYWFAFAIGVSAGAAVALLYAPQSGAKTRKRLRAQVDNAGEYVDNASDYLKQQADRLSSETQSAFRKTKKQASDLADTAADRASSVAGKAKSMV